ncbi:MULTISPECIES: FAD-dependent monooxygenase [Legionella]|uniref:2-octaprenyl-6-methoxyphenyl hydroxylase n=1 Tax=Legionella septentrionalis TaxID=2498109 RepID=A0A3S0VBR6_9GAMM|nr:FAD-dependent monooxygenase [Legionella septentrionalis]MCP0914792.1 FAD-dependent monooxygenase [Legionella sp. 27cVA30]RUQ91073.1 2-octaprenyl-6-methoxyphenyl hydroxylase [Legionella septentrionalis]RUR02858.1 2-octaprenyl-6-methoxyphenyl hydroxylase [Legionella septentrionalis]RUR11456.1 2-octaprenyl-6-methoxyphenyl hydroxylase [Legionella septentrionalis]
MVEKEIDILIIGGGLTGATLVLALAAMDLQVLLVEARPFSDKIKADFDSRSLALSPASVQILTKINVWPKLKNHAMPIETIHVSEKLQFGSARLEGNRQHPLGHVVEMQHIQTALHELLPAQQILAPASLLALDAKAGIATIHHGDACIKVKAKLIVAADGSDSCVRQLCGLSAEIKDYKQHALVANMGLSRPHRQFAYERFTRSGPMALLPMTDLRAALVWSLAPADAEKMHSLPEPDFLAILHKEFGYRLGRFTKVGQRSLYPLRQIIMPKQTAWPIIFVGNAAHTLHPVAGQGFNLGLRDVAVLAQCIAQKGLNPGMLNHYQQLRQHDQHLITRLTDGLISLFSSRIPGFAGVRSLGLIALNHTSFLKKLLMRYASGYAGIVPNLVCGIPLEQSAEASHE